MMDKMTIMEGLKELKLIDSKIMKLIGRRITDNSAMRSNVAPPYEDKQAEKVKSWIQAADDLIIRKGKIRCAILEANLATKVTFHGREYSLQEILFLKDGGKKSSSRSGFWLMEQLIQALKGDKAVESEISRMGISADKDKPTITVKRYFDIEERDKREDFLASAIQNLDALLEHANVTTHINLEPLKEEE